MTKINSSAAHKISEAKFRQLSNKLKTAGQVQEYIRHFRYNRSNTLRSAYSTWKQKSAHCFEAVLFAAAVLEFRGYPPLIVSIESQDYLDHVLFVYRRKLLWGSVGRSRDEGLHGRKPVFQNLKALVKSYSVPYVDGSGRITGYALTSLDESGTPWRSSPRNVWALERSLNELKHTPLKMSDIAYSKALAHYERHKSHVAKASWK